MKLVRIMLAMGAVVAFSRTAAAADYYVDPATGSPGNDGSQGSPWSTLEDIQGQIGSQVQGGDTVYLLSGYHGAAQLSGISAATPIVIEAMEGHDPRLARVEFNGSSGVTLRGVSVSPEYAPAYSNATIISISGDSSAITVEGCELFSVADASGWSDADWDSMAANGIDVGGDNITILDNLLTTVNFAINVSATNSLIRGNVVDGFSGDGMRGLGDFTVFEYNTVKNCYAVNDNHDDGFQSWSNGPGGVGSAEVTGVVLRGNTIINYEDPNQPYRCTLQGIGMFDGTFVDWVIENNIVITDHWHGITLLGARGSRVVNNTVLDPNAESPGPPWISINSHKNGTAPEDCVVRNNLTTDLDNAGSGVTEDTNTIIENPDELFVDVENYDVHLLENAPVVDQGSTDLAPELDADQIPRPQLGGIDIGAYEWHDEIVDPTTGGEDSSDSGQDGDGDSGTNTSGASDSADDSADSGGESGGSGGGSGGADDEGDSGCGCTTRPGPMPMFALFLLALGGFRGRSRALD